MFKIQRSVPFIPKPVHNSQKAVPTVGTNLSTPEIEYNLQLVLDKIQPRGENDEVPLLKELSGLISTSISEPNHIESIQIKTREILNDLLKFKNFLASLKAEKGLNIKKYSFKIFSYLNVFAKQVNIEYLLFKIQKLEHLAKDILQYCIDLQNSQQNSLDKLLTELNLKVNRIEDHHANPELDEHISQFGKALTLAARTSTDDFNNIMLEGKQPASLNGVIAGLAAGGVDIVGSCLSNSKTIFRKMDDKINKNILLMQLNLLFKSEKYTEIEKNPSWQLLKTRITQINSQHINFSALPAMFRGQTTSLRIQKAIDTSAQRVEKLNSGLNLRKQTLLSEFPQTLEKNLIRQKSKSLDNQHAPLHMDGLLKKNTSHVKSLEPLLSVVLDDVLQLENSLARFVAGKANSQLAHKITEHLKNILTSVGESENDKTLLCDHLWNKLNSHKYFYRAGKPGVTLRQVYQTPLDFLMDQAVAKDELAILVKALSFSKDLVNADFITVFNSLHASLESVTKTKIIQTMHLVNLVLQYNQRLTPIEKALLHKKLFVNRFHRDHGNLRKIANGHRTESLKRKFAVDFFRYCLHNSSTIRAILPDGIIINNEILSSDNLAAEILRWNAFQGVARVSCSNLMYGVVELSHTANTLDMLYEKQCQIFNTQQVENIAEDDLLNFRDILQKVTATNRLSVSYNPSIEESHKHILHVPVHREFHPELEGEEVLSVTIIPSDEAEDPSTDGSIADWSLDDKSFVMLGEVSDGDANIFTEDPPALIEDNIKQLRPYKQHEGLFETKEVMPTKDNLDQESNILRYKFNRLQDLAEKETNSKNKVILPEIVHAILAEKDITAKMELIKDFYCLAKLDPQISNILHNDAEKCSVTDFDKLITELLGFTTGAKSNRKYNPLVVLILLYGCVMNDPNDESRAEKLLMLNEVIHNINDSRGILFNIITPSIIKVFAIEMTLSCVCATCYAIACTFAFPFAVSAQFVINWFRVAANDSRTIAILSRKLITTNREKALKKINAIINQELPNPDHQILQEFYQDLSHRKLAKYTDRDLSIQKEELVNSSQQVLVHNRSSDLRELEQKTSQKIQLKLKKEADIIIQKIYDKIKLQVKEPDAGLILSPVKFLLMVEEELKLSFSINKNFLLRKLLLLRQIITDYPFENYSQESASECRSLVFAISLICMQKGILAPLLRQEKARLADAFIAKENVIIAITSLLPKIAGFMAKDEIAKTLYGAAGDSIGTFTSNLLPELAKYPRGYQKVMQIFKAALLKNAKKIDFNKPVFEKSGMETLILDALGAHTSSVALKRIGKTDSVKKFKQILAANEKEHYKNKMSQRLG